MTYKSLKNETRALRYNWLQVFTIKLRGDLPYFNRISPGCSGKRERHK